MPKNMKLNDLLGPAKKTKVKKADLDDILGPRKTRQKGDMTYEPLKPPKTPQAGGIWALRDAKGKNLGRTCLICKDELKSKGGRPPVICKKKTCFRAYRNAYRKDYDTARAS